MLALSNIHASTGSSDDTKRLKTDTEKGAQLAPVTMTTAGIQGGLGSLIGSYNSFSSDSEVENPQENKTQNQSTTSANSLEATMNQPTGINDQATVSNNRSSETEISTVKQTSHIPNSNSLELLANVIRTAVEAADYPL